MGQLKTSNIKLRKESRTRLGQEECEGSGCGRRPHSISAHVTDSSKLSPCPCPWGNYWKKVSPPKQISSHVITQSIFAQHEDKIWSLKVSLFWSPKWKQTLMAEVAHLRPRGRHAEPFIEAIELGSRRPLPGRNKGLSSTKRKKSKEAFWRFSQGRTRDLLSLCNFNTAVQEKWFTLK